jgi:predicted transcriptional regulator
MDSENLLECPICGKKFKSLIGHMRYIHDMNPAEFKEKYPNTRMHIDNRIRGTFLCDICGYSAKTPNSIGRHMKSVHPKEYSDRNQKEEHGLKCLICGKITPQLSQHIFCKHRISWEEYCSKYNYIGPKSLFSDSHKKCLSVNKKAFYDGNAGLIQKQKQSVLYSGDSNPAKDISVRRKISEAAIRRKDSHPTFYKRSWGIWVEFNFNGETIKTRSYTEFMIIHTLLNNNFTINYETEIIKYTKEDGSIHNYICDVMINGIYYEIKPRLKDITRENKITYAIVKGVLNDIGSEFKILTLDSFESDFGIPLPKPLYFIELCKKMLVDNKIKFNYFLPAGRKDCKLFRKLDANYETNPLITVTRGEKK